MSGMRPISEIEYTKTKEELQYSLRNKCLFILGYRTGFRISELLSIRIEDVYDPYSSAILDTVKVCRSSMKGKKSSREVSLHNEAKQNIHEYLKSLEYIDISAPLFQSRNGENKSLDRRTAWLILKEAYKKAGLTGSVATHSMRKSFSKKIHEALGNDILKTSKALGHSSILTTIKYLPVDQEEINTAIQNID